MCTSWQECRGSPFGWDDGGVAACHTQLLQASPAAPLNAAPLWRRGDLSTDELMAEYQRECSVVRRGIDADLGKVPTIRMLEC